MTATRRLVAILAAPHVADDSRLDPGRAGDRLAPGERLALALSARLFPRWTLNQHIV